MSDLFQAEATTIAFDDEFLSPDMKAKELVEQINWVTTHRKYEYIDQLVNLRGHKSVSVRRKLAGSMGVLASKSEIATLEKWQLAEADRDTWLVLESVIDRLNRGIEGTKNIEDKIYTVSEALKLIKNLIGQKEYTIEGELSEVRPVRQMYYFGLKDSSDVRIDCGAFAGVVARLGFALNEGLTVRVKGKFRVGKNSRLYFDVRSIVLTGEGELKRNLELLKKKLVTEGLLDETRKRIPKKVPDSVLLMASSTSAAYSDFIKVLRARNNRVRIYTLSIKTQGIGAEFDLLEKLEKANQYISNHSIETVVITRGGGSQDDLAVFNSEKVARAVHGLAAPSIVAIGHERDFTICELVADVRASTPSNAAELVSKSKAEIAKEVQVDIGSLKQYFQSRKSDYLITTQKLQISIQRTLQFMIEEARRKSGEVTSVLSNLMYNIKSESKEVFNQLIRFVDTQRHLALRKLDQMEKIPLIYRNRIDIIRSQNKENLNIIINNLNQVTIQKNLKLNKIFAEIKSYDPSYILSKGYALIRQEGVIVESKKAFKKDKNTEIEFGDGKVVTNN